VAPAFYQKLFNHNGYWNVFSRVVARKKLTVNAASWLDNPLTDKKIYKALTNMHPEKAPGPDGFNAIFFQQNWNVVGSEVNQAIQSFFSIVNC